MRYHFQPSFARLRQAHRTLIRSTPWRRLRFHWLMWGNAVLALVCIGIFGQYPHVPHWADFAETCLVGSLIALAFVLPVTRPVLLRRAYKTGMDGVRQGQLAFFEIAGDTLVSGFEGLQESRLQRSAVTKVVEGKDMLLLFLTRKHFLYIAKDELPAEGLAELRAWLARPGASA